MAVKKNQDEIAYSFLRYANTEEVHVFEGKFTPSSCTANFASICGKVEDRRKEVMETIEICLDEEEARLYAANIGRKVCGTCISRLYATFKD
jgi:hypothetical protein